MRFPPSFLERLRSHFLISEVIGKRIPLKKHGREYQACCPFHNEKTPSFTVNDEKGFFHCFGCGAHGDAIEFVRKYERLSYPETIETLAREAGIPLPQETPEEKKRNEVEKTLYDVLEAACQWFERQLASSEGITARDYLEKRGLRLDTQRTFRIGYATEERTALYNHMLTAGFSQPLQAQAGLIILPEGGGAPYDRFRGRVMFPIRNASGKIVAFGGRLIAHTANKNLPKYLNSPETPLFKKGEMLYNLDLAKRAAREATMAVVMEGYVDVVSTAQAGVPYAVATLGTAVTPEHLRLLWQLAKEPVMCLDGDVAGKRAMMRAAEVALPLLKPGYSLRFAVLPAGEDPDSYVQKHGKTGFEKIIASSQRLSQVLWETLLPQYRIDAPEGLAALKDACARTARTIEDATVRNEYALHFERHLFACKRQLERKLRIDPLATQPRAPQVAQMMAQPETAGLEKLVRDMLLTALRFPELLHRADVEETLHRLDIMEARLDALRQALLSAPPEAMEDADGLKRHIESQLPDGIPGDMAVYRAALSPEEALYRWGESTHAYRMALLEVDIARQEKQCALSMEEEDFRRLGELKETLHKARASRTFAPAEQDTV